MEKMESDTARVYSLIPDFSFFSRFFFFFPHQLVHHKLALPSLALASNHAHCCWVFFRKRCGAIVRTAQCLNGVAVTRIPARSVPLLKHGGRLCQPNKALVSNTKRHCGSPIVTHSTSYHVEKWWSDGVLQRGAAPEGPQGYYGCKSPSHSSAPGQGERHH